MTWLSLSLLALVVALWRSVVERREHAKDMRHLLASLRELEERMK
jgi:hypothetical protein